MYPSWVGKLNIVKMAHFPNWSADPLISLLVGFLFAEINKPILKFVWRFKGLRIAKMILKKENNDGSVTLYNFKTYWKTTIIKIMWYL